MFKRTANSVENKLSRYVQGGTTMRYPKRLGWWERVLIKKDDTDIVITVSPSEERRPDLIAYRVYGDSSLMWLVLQFNNIVDINTEIVTGKQLRLPSERRVMMDIMVRQTGGKIVK